MNSIMSLSIIIIIDNGIIELLFYCFCNDIGYSSIGF